MAIIGKCPNCEKMDAITLENGELLKQSYILTESLIASIMIFIGVISAKTSN